MNERDTEQPPPAKQTLQVEPEAVREAIEEFEREIPALAEAAERELLRSGEEYAPIKGYVRLSLRLAVTEARLALLEGRTHQALRILSRKQIEGF